MIKKTQADLNRFVSYNRKIQFYYLEDYRFGRNTLYSEQKCPFFEEFRGIGREEGGLAALREAGIHLRVAPQVIESLVRHDIALENEPNLRWQCGAYLRL